MTTIITDGAGIFKLFPCNYTFTTRNTNVASLSLLAAIDVLERSKYPLGSIRWESLRMGGFNETKPIHDITRQEHATNLISSSYSTE